MNKSDQSQPTTKIADRVSKSGSKAKKTKKQMVVDLLSSKVGATMDSLHDLTGWQPHTIRATLSTLRKSGTPIERQDRTGKPTLYKICMTSKSRAKDASVDTAGSATS